MKENMGSQTDWVAECLVGAVVVAVCSVVVVVAAAVAASAVQGEAAATW